MENSKLIKISDRIYGLPAINELDRPFLYYVKGKDFSIAIDAGQSKEHVDEFYSAITSAGFSLPKYTIITHWHWDHSFGMPFVTGKTIVSDLCQKQLDIVKSWEWTKEAMAKRVKDKLDLGAVNRFIMKVFPDLSRIKVCTGDICLTKKMELDLGDIRVHILPLDSIHSRDSLLIFCPEEKALFVGDADCPDYYNNGEVLSERVTEYKDTIEKLDFDTYFIGHDIWDTRDQVLERLEKMVM